MDRKRLEAEKLYDSANDEAVRWRNEASRRWAVSVKLGEEWLALKKQLGLVSNASHELPPKAVSSTACSPDISRQEKSLTRMDKGSAGDDMPKNSKW
jgi:hypothetical protein